MATALHAELAVTSCMNIREMVTFLHKEFDVIVSKSAISRALKEVRLTHKAAKVIANERNEAQSFEHIWGLDSELLPGVGERPCIRKPSVD
ncbi:hypothetical protein BKA56DRAFT_584168 [Ilyonectria sp. MPI-CAGE-AT-0026]|nr:hypothetical protein BKA56DRAFT_584168 [Ilyonectria sp. MPI-CAGE-AT-0026]